MGVEAVYIVLPSSSLLSTCLHEFALLSSLNSVSDLRRCISAGRAGKLIFELSLTLAYTSANGRIDLELLTAKCVDVGSIRYAGSASASLSRFLSFVGNSDGRYRRDTYLVSHRRKVYLNAPRM